MLKKFHPRRYIAGITIGWGIVATLTGVVRDYKGLLGVRLLLGALEAGLFPGLTVSFGLTLLLSFIFGGRFWDSLMYGAWSKNRWNKVNGVDRSI